MNSKMFQLCEGLFLNKAANNFSRLRNYFNISSLLVIGFKGVYWELYQGIKYFRLPGIFEGFFLGSYSIQSCISWRCKEMKKITDLCVSTIQVAALCNKSIQQTGQNTSRQKIITCNIGIWIYREWKESTQCCQQTRPNQESIQVTWSRPKKESLSLRLHIHKTRQGIMLIVFV